MTSPDSSKMQVVGVSKQDEQKIRDLLTAFGAEKLPVNGVAVLPERAYNTLRGQIENGTLAGHNIAATSGQGGQENFGRGFEGNTRLGDGLTIKQIGRTYINAKLLDNPAKLSQVLAHEIAHTNAADDSEDGADKLRDLYLSRAAQAQKIDAGTQAQPVSTQPAPGILSGSIKDVQPPAAPQGGVLGGISNQGQTK